MAFTPKENLDIALSELRRFHAIGIEMARKNVKLAFGRGIEKAQSYLDWATSVGPLTYCSGQSNSKVTAAVNKFLAARGECVALGDITRDSNKEYF